MVFLAKDVDLRLASCQTAIDQALSVLGVPLVSPPADQPAQTVVERAKRLEASLCALEKALLPTDAELERQLAALEEESKQKAERMNKIQQVCGKLDKMVQDELKAQPAQPEEVRETLLITRNYSCRKLVHLLKMKTQLMLLGETEL